MNWTKTFLLMGILTALFMGVGYLLHGRTGMIFALVLAGGMNFVSYWFSDRIVLSMYGAQPISESDSPELTGIIRKLTQKSGLPMPKLYLMQTDVPNAFATGRDPQHAAVAVTSGLLRILNSDEIEGVIAHELSHVKNRDILIGTIAATLAGAIMMIASMARWAAMFGGMRSDDDDNGGIIGLLVAIIVAPLADTLIQMAISRSREYQADASGAEMAGNPNGLANALLKLERGNEMMQTDASPATAHMFIVNPLRGGGISSLFSTHPSTEKRVERLRSLSQFRA